MPNKVNEWLKQTELEQIPDMASDWLEQTSLSPIEEEEPISQGFWGEPERVYYDEEGNVVHRETAKQAPTYKGKYFKEKIETPTGTKVIGEIKSQWASDWPQYVGLGLMAVTAGILHLPAIQSRIISQGTDKFAAKNLSMLKKKFPNLIKTTEDAKAYSELAARGYIDEITKSKYWVDLNPVSQMEMVKRISNNIGKVILSPTVSGSLPKIADSSSQLSIFLQNPQQGLITFANLQTKLEQISPQFPALIDAITKTIGKGSITNHEILSLTSEYIPVKQKGEQFVIIDKLRELFGIKPDAPRQEDIIAIEQGTKLSAKSLQEETFIAPETEIPAMEIGKELAKEAVKPSELEGVGLSIKEINKGKLPTFISPDIADAIKYSEGEARFTLIKLKDTLGNAFYRNYALRFKLKKEDTDMLFRNFFSTRELREADVQNWLKHTFGVVTAEDDIALTLHQQMPDKYPISDRLKDVANKQAAVYEFLDGVLRSHGVYKEPMPLSLIKRTQKQIDAIKEELTYLVQPASIKERKERIEKLEQTIALLEGTRYLPQIYHGRIQDFIIEESADPIKSKGIDITKLIPRRYTNTINATFKEVLGRKFPTLEEAAKQGYIPELSARTIMGKYLLYVGEEIAKVELSKKIIADREVALPAEQAPDDWVGVALKAFKGYKVYPALAEAIDEVAGVRGKTWEPIEWYSKVASIAKRLKFYIPSIMMMNNLEQAYLAAGVKAAIDPRLWNWSITQLLNNTPTYQEFIKRDLFPTPPDIRPSRQSQEKMIMTWVRHMDKNYPKVSRALEKASNGELNFKGKSVVESGISTIKGAYNMLWNVTWTMDRIQRMNTTRRLMEKGMTLNDAVERARYFHVDYADLPAQARKFMNMILLTPTYRTGMAKVYGSMFTHPVKYKGPLSRLILAWLAIAAGATAGGYTLKEFYRMTKPTEEGEEVIIIPGPIAELQKYLGRGPFGTYNLQSSVPIYVFRALEKNEDWKGEKIWQPGSPGGTPEQATQIAYFLLKNVFPPMEGIEMLSNKQEKLRNRLLRFLAVSAYTRKDPNIYKHYKLQSLSSDARQYLLWKYPPDVYPDGPPLDAIDAVVERARQRGESLVEGKPSILDFGSQIQKGLLWGLNKLR